VTTHFRLEQLFDAGPGEVEAAFLDPGIFAALSDLPNVGRPELVDQLAEGDAVRQRVRYRFTGHLAPGAAKVVDPRKLSWVQETTAWPGSLEAAFEIHPDHYADRLSCAGVVTIEPVDGGSRTCRTTLGTLKVRFALVGGRVERAIVDGLKEAAAAEACAVQEWLDGRRG
jgi:hypothetical protein